MIFDKYQTRLSWRHIWKYRLQNAGHLVHVSRLCWWFVPVSAFGTAVWDERVTLWLCRCFLKMLVYISTMCLQQGMPLRWSSLRVLNFTEAERSSGWLPWPSLETLKLVFNVPSDDQGSQPGDLSVSVLFKSLQLIWRSGMPCPIFKWAAITWHVCEGTMIVVLTMGARWHPWHTACSSTYQGVWRSPIGWPQAFHWRRRTKRPTEGVSHTTARCWRGEKTGMVNICGTHAYQPLNHAELDSRWACPQGCCSLITANSV